MAPAALAQKRTGTGEETRYLSAFTSILNIKSECQKHIFFLKKASVSLSVSCFWTTGKIHINAEKNPSEN